MWSQLNVSSVHQDFSEVMSEILSVLDLEKDVFTGAVRCFMLIVRVACLNCFSEGTALSISKQNLCLQ